MPWPPQVGVPRYVNRATCNDSPANPAPFSSVLNPRAPVRGAAIAQLYPRR